MELLNGTENPIKGFVKPLTKIIITIIQTFIVIFFKGNVVLFIPRFARRLALREGVIEETVGFL